MMNTVTVKARTMDGYALEILEGVSTSGATENVTRQHWDGSGEYIATPWVAQAYIVYTDETDGVCFGPVRWRTANGWVNADGTKEDYWSVSPFPGAWADVPASRILNVRKTLD